MGDSGARGRGRGRGRGVMLARVPSNASDISAGTPAIPPNTNTSNTTSTHRSASPAISQAIPKFNPSLPPATSVPLSPSTNAPASGVFQYQPGHPQYPTYLAALQYYMNHYNVTSGSTSGATGARVSPASTSEGGTPNGSPQLAMASLPNPTSTAAHDPSILARQIPPFPLLQNLPGAYQPNLGRAGAPAFPNRPNLPIVEPATLPVLSKEKIRQLVTQIDPYERLENDVEEMMMEIADDFITKIAEKSCKLAKHRGSESVAVKDARIPVEIDWGIRVPGFGGERDDKDDSGDKGQLTDVEKVRLHMTRTNKIREAVRESSRVARGLPGSHTKKGTNARAKRRGVSAGRVNI